MEYDRNANQKNLRGISAVFLMKNAGCNSDTDPNMQMHDPDSYRRLKSST